MIDDYYCFGDRTVGEWHEKEIAKEDAKETSIKPVRILEPKNNFHQLQQLLKNLESYLDIDLEDHDDVDTYSLLQYARRTVREAVESMREAIVDDVISSDNKTRD